MKTNDTSGIVFDTKSGISEEEQREILAKIDNIAEKNRLSLSESGKREGKSPRFKAKKTGGFFPIAVNIAAIAALAGGLAVLSSTQWKTDAQARTGSKVYNSVERALIEEIRKETSSLLEAKDREISMIISKLEEIDVDLFGLGQDNRELTKEEQAARDRLKGLQEEYRSTLAVLQDERSQILEDARAREAAIQAQLESRTRELAAVSQLNTAVSLTGGELERLNTEQFQAAAVEAQMGAFFANLNKQITDNNFDEATGTIKAMRDFINTPAFGSLRSIQARKGLYTQAINSFETMIGETQKYQAALNSDNPGANPLADFNARIAQLEKDMAEKDKTIESLSSQGSGASRRLNELQKANSDLQTNNRQLERTNNDLKTQNNKLTSDLTSQTRLAANWQQDINTLQQSERDLKAETARLNQTVAARDSTISSNENTIRDLRRQNETQTQRLNRIQEVVQGKAAVNMTIAELSDSVSRIQEVLGQ